MMKFGAVSLSAFCLVSALVAGCGGSSSSSTSTPPPPSAPTVALIAPASIAAGAGATTLTVDGTGYTRSTVIQVNGTAEATTFVSATEVTAVVPAGQVASGGNLKVVAVNGDQSSGSGTEVDLVVNNPSPTVTSLAPSSVVAGSPATTVVINGSGFVPTTAVQVNGVPRGTTYTSSKQVSVALTAADLATTGMLEIAAVNTAPGGGSSTASTLKVTPSLPPVVVPTPVLNSVTPMTFIAGSPDTQMGVTSSYLDQNSVVQWNGQLLTILQGYNYTGAGYYVVVTVPAALLTTIGSASVTILQPNATPSVSNAIVVQITNPPVPTLTSLSPAAAPINTATTITLAGTGFSPNSVAAYNGTNLATTFVDSTLLTVNFAGAVLPGNGNFTVTTPAPGGGTSAAVPFTSYIGIVNNSMVYNPANGLLYVSVPSSAGPPYANSVVSVDPETGALGTPIFVGSEPNKLAISSDGTVLWVGLDGASAVRQVDLTTGKAGLQFTLGANSGVYANPATALALAALPGSPNSVVVSTTSNFVDQTLSIYDSGVLRGSTTGNAAFNAATALQVDGTRNEVYAASPNTYTTYTYNSSGLALLATSGSPGPYALQGVDDLQVAGGRAYTDQGGVYDAESGSLLGTDYAGGTTPAVGPTIADLTLGRIFVLDASSSNSFGQYIPIQQFKTSDFTTVANGTLPINVAGFPLYPYNQASHLTRWGTNGLAFQTPVGVFSVQSNLVKDVSANTADLGVAVTVSGSNATGATSTYTATISNSGPAGATDVALTGLLPSTGTLASVTPSVGTCSSSSNVVCNLGSVAAGASATVTFVVNQLTAGNGVLTAQVTAAETDPDTANNQASATAAVTGATYSITPTITAITPAAILAGAADTTITVSGAGLGSASTVLIDGVAMPTTVAPTTTGSVGTQLTATVPAAKLKELGWSAVTVTNAAPGGGISAALPLSVYSVITLGLNHIVYDPYSRNIMASVGSGSTAVTGNSIVAITPETQAVSTPVSIGSQPENLALTDDGQILYTILAGSQGVARYNMLTQQADFTYTVTPGQNFDGGVSLRGIATKPGTENTVALDIADFSGNAIYDFDPVNKTAAIRGQASGPYSGSCISFLDAGDLLAFDTDTTGATLDHYQVTSAGFTYYNNQQYTESTLLHFGCFKLSGGLAYANGGGIANPAPSPAVQIGVLAGSLGGGTFSSSDAFVPDASLQHAFYMVPATGASSYGTPNNAIGAYDVNTYSPTTVTPLDFATIEGNTSYNMVDMIRWGQDGLAVLTNGGHLYLLRGAVVAPQLLNQNSAAVLTSSSTATLALNGGNALLTLTGSNFIPGVAVTWNGGYRTTTIVDATHVTVAIPASDLAAAGSATLVATNPGAVASGALTVTVQ